MVPVNMSMIVVALAGAIVHFGQREFVVSNEHLIQSNGQSYRSTVGRGGCSFQFGRTSMWRPRAPHLAHTTLLANERTSSNYGTNSSWSPPRLAGVLSR
jgi:hypothetical protein